tara:strand:- start:42 stop:983 length:942 start_codon:yes stop_codon:yes gene_type:complete
MGIKQLNKFLKFKAKEILTQIHFSELYGKKVCVDTMIYIYKYKKEGALLENFYKMCIQFRKYNIQPIFIFDGNIPEEKKYEIQRRKELKNKAKEELEKLNDIKNLTLEQVRKKDELTKMIIKPNNEDINDVKNLIELCGYKYIVSDGEADTICCYLVKKKTVFACISEDMDMFCYGCPRVLRYFNIRHNTMVLYNLSDILKKINMNFINFKWLCILSGTDYHTSYNKKKNIFYYYKLYCKYVTFDNIKMNFYDWLIETKLLDDVDEDYIKIFNMFQLKNIDLKYIVMRTGYLNMPLIYNLLEKEHFINPLKVY